MSRFRFTEDYEGADLVKTIVVLLQYEYTLAVVYRKIT